MIELRINHLTADVPDDFAPTIEYQNPFFTKSGSFSLDIDLPLAGSRANCRIFGSIHRLERNKQEKSFPATLRVGGITVFAGIATIMKVTDREVTVQLMGGNSVMNFYSESVVISELDLGDVVVEIPSKDLLSGWYVPWNNTTLFGSVDECDAVFFPAASSAGGLYPNSVCYSPHPNSLVAANTIGILYPHYCSVQPYFLFALRRIVEARGYRITRNDINDTWMRNLYIVNCKNRRPFSWQTLDANHVKARLADALPDWSFNKFVDEVEKFFCVVFVVDDLAKNLEIISLDRFYNTEGAARQIADDRVVDEYEFDITTADLDKNVTNGNVGYHKSYSDKYLRPDPSILRYSETRDYPDFTALITEFSDMSNDAKKNIIFRDRATHRTYISYKYEQNQYGAREINVFGNLVRDPASDNLDVELNIVPANTRRYNFGFWRSMSGNAFATTPDEMNYYINLPYIDSPASAKTPTDGIQQMIENSENLAPATTTENDVIEVAISTGTRYDYGLSPSGRNMYYPMMFTDHAMYATAPHLFPDMSLSLNPVCEQSVGRRMESILKVDNSKEYTISILADRPFNAKEIFLIHNQKYVCHSLKASYNAHHRMFLYEGTFYRIGE